MSQPSNKISILWQELKRRKVVRVITVYAAAAFVILELVDIIAEPLKLPSWLIPVVIVLLSIGFIIAIILSWIYDVKPEGGIVRTEPAYKVKEQDIPKSSNSWKIASYFSFVVIVGLIVLNIIPRSSRSEVKEILDKSIAVLPFVNESSDEENTYFINGIMQDLLLNLQSIKDLRVLGRTSVEQYRNSTKSIPEIAEELSIQYLIEATGQRYGNTFVLRIMLLEGEKDEQVWGDKFELEIKSAEDFVSLQSTIAKSIATELEAIITPEEKELIEKIHTTNLTAYDFYQRGREEYLKISLFADNTDILNKAGNFYYKALEYDSTFARAYAGLAGVYFWRDYQGTVFSENYLDSVRILSDIALSYNDQLTEAYTVRGFYYENLGDNEQAITEFDKAIKLNPNDGMPYYGKGLLYAYDDFIKAIDNFQIAASLNRGSELPEILGRISWMYEWAGFTEKAIHFNHEALNLDGDSVEYYRRAGNIEYSKPGDPEKSIEFSEKGYAIDSSNHLEISRLLAYRYMVLGQNEEALKYCKINLELHKDQGQSPFHVMREIGYVYWQMGNKEKAEYYFNEYIINSNKIIELGGEVGHAFMSRYFLASVYAFRGEKDKAYENLRIFNLRQIMPSWMVVRIKNDPLFDSIRDEPEFQQIVRNVEAKYQAEHERVRQWLEDNDML